MLSMHCNYCFHLLLCDAMVYLMNALYCRTTGQPGSAAVAAPPTSNSQPGRYNGHYTDWVMKNMTQAVAGASLGIWVRFSGCLSKQLVRLLVWGALQ